MGINSGSAELLRVENESLPFSGSILQLGRQHFSFATDDREFLANSGLVKSRVWIVLTMRERTLL